MCHEGRSQRLLHFGFAAAARSLHRAGSGRTAAALATATLSRFPRQRNSYSRGSCGENTVFRKKTTLEFNRSVVAWQTATLSASPACRSWTAAGRAALASCWCPDLPLHSPVTSTSAVLLPGERACGAPFPLLLPQTPVCLVSAVFSLKPRYVLTLKCSDS